MCAQEIAIQTCCAGVDPGNHSKGEPGRDFPGCVHCWSGAAQASVHVQVQSFPFQLSVIKPDSKQYFWPGINV